MPLSLSAMDSLGGPVGVCGVTKMKIHDLQARRAAEIGLQEEVRSTLLREAEAVASFARHGVEGICDAIDLIDERRGSLVVSGVGKSGHIGRKIASTFRSLGRHSVFMHAAEGSHGDLGLIDPNGVVLVLSNSGETAELADLLAYCADQDIPIISITGGADSTLARASSVCISYGKLDEVCINGLAPTTSTTLSLAIGDALAVGYSHLNGVTAEDFRRYHPGGRLGARLRTVRDVMRTGDDLPIVPPDAALVDITLTIAEKSLGCALVMENGKMHGIITDGDIRRHASRIKDLRAIDIATSNPVAVDPDANLETAALELSQAKVSVGIVRDRLMRTVGILHIHHCVLD